MSCIVEMYSYVLYSTYCFNIYFTAGIPTSPTCAMVNTYIDRNNERCKLKQIPREIRVSTGVRGLTRNHMLVK